MATISIAINYNNKFVQREDNNLTDKQLKLRSNENNCSDRTNHHTCNSCDGIKGVGDGWSSCAKRTYEEIILPLRRIRNIKNAYSAIF